MIRSSYSIHTYWSNIVPNTANHFKIIIHSTAVEFTHHIEIESNCTKCLWNACTMTIIHFRYLNLNTITAFFSRKYPYHTVFSFLCPHLLNVLRIFRSYILLAALQKYMLAKMQSKIRILLKQKPLTAKPCYLKNILY